MLSHIFLGCHKSVTARSRRWLWSASDHRHPFCRATKPQHSLQSVGAFFSALYWGSNPSKL